MRLKLLISLTLALALCCDLGRAAEGTRTLSKNDLLKLLAGGVYNPRIASLVHYRGINFVPTSHDLESFRRAGAGQALLHEVITAPRVLPQVTQHPPELSNQLLIVPQSVKTVPGGAAPSAGGMQTRASKPLPPRVTPPQLEKPEIEGPSSLRATVPAGIRITMRNWTQYRKYMPAGMIELFEGHRFWKMPADLEIVIGPTLPERLPARFNQATTEHSGKVEVVHLPDGHNDIRNYIGGEPFPHPKEPDKGYKLLADLWFAYVPHLLVGTIENPLSICSETAHRHVSCERLSYVFRQTAFNTDGGASAEELRGTDYWYTEWTSVEEPEELRYTTLLTLYPKDNRRQKELFEFLPSLRRWFRSSLAAGCSPVVGTDYAEDDFKRVRFNGGIGSFEATFLGHKQVVALTGHYAPLGGEFPANYYMPLGWPRPSWGSWQVRDVDIIDVRRISGERAGYCYGKRIMYADSDTHYALWEDAYDRNMHLWKIALLAQRIVDGPSLGDVPGAFTSTAWDVEKRHLTNTTTQGKDGRDVLIDGAAPAQYNNFVAYATPSGLAQIMK